MNFLLLRVMILSGYDFCQFYYYLSIGKGFIAACKADSSASFN